MPSGASYGGQSGTRRSSLRASKVEPSGVQGVPFFPSFHEDTREAGTEPQGTFDGASAALAAAAVLTCAVTMWGVGLQRFAGSPAELLPMQQQAISSSTSQVPARLSQVQVGVKPIQVTKQNGSSKKLVAARSISAPPISSRVRLPAKLNAVAIELRDDARMILKNGHRVPAGEVLQSTGIIAVGAQAGNAFRSYAQKRSRSASSKTHQAPGSRGQAAKSALGAAPKASTTSLSSSTTSLMSGRSATSAAKKKLMTFVHDMSFSSLPGTQENEEKALKQYLLDMRHVRSRG